MSPQCRLLSKSIRITSSHVDFEPTSRIVGFRVFSGLGSFGVSALTLGVLGFRAKGFSGFGFGGFAFMLSA